MSNERIDLTQFDWMEHHSIKHMEDTGDLAIVDVNAIQMIPDLIAELKRCYEEIDQLREDAYDLIDIIDRLDPHGHKQNQSEKR